MSNHAGLDRFAPPRQRRTAIPRPRLIERLHANVGTGLAVLQAPAGFGKTALASAFAETLDFDLRWLTLDASATSPEVFAEHLGRALVGDGSWSPAAATKTDDLRAYLATSVATARQSSDRPILLVVDNAHFLRDSEEAADLMGWYLETQPEGWELILASRDATALVEVDRRVAAGECLYLASSELAFDLDEVSAALGEGSSASPARVLETTRGWPAAVLAVASGAIGIEGLDDGGQHAAWARYLAAEVWNHVPAEHQQALLRVSLAPVVPESLGETTLGGPAWRSLKAWLGERDFLFESLPRHAIRINPLFREFLIAEYERRSPDTYTSDSAAVCEWLEANNDVAGAIELARDARNGPELARLLTRHSAPLLEQGAYALLWRAFEHVPPEQLNADPVLNGFYAHVLARNNRPAPALAIAQAVLDDPASPGAARMHAILARVRALRLTGEREALEHVFDDVRAVTDCQEPAVAAEVAWQEAQLVLALEADFARAERLIHQGIALAKVANASTLELLMRSTLGQSQIMRGAGPEGVNELVRAAQGWRELRGTSHLGWVLNNLGMGYQLVGEFGLATEVLEEAVREGKLCENKRNEAYAIASLGDAELALGNFEKARIQYEEAIRITAEDVLDESLAALSIAGLAGAFLGLGDTQQSDFFADRALLIAESFGNPFEMGTCRMQLAMAQDAANEYETATRLLTTAIDDFTGIDARGALRVAWYRLARVQFRRNRKDDALESLGKLAAVLDAPWTYGALSPSIREHALFAQWVASRNVLGPTFREMLDRQHFSAAAEESREPADSSGLPPVVATSLGRSQVTVAGKLVSEEAWSSARARELFFLFLANRDGIRKEAAVEQLYPDLPASRCNSAFHSNVYRLRKAIYAESIVKNDGVYQLNPEGDFSWDVSEFEEALAGARRLKAGSDARETAIRTALDLYNGPFAEEFYSEWAETLRGRLQRESLGALASLAGHYAGRSDFTAAAECLERLLDNDHLNDEAAYQLATYRARAGEASAALSFLDSYRTRFESELEEELPSRFDALRRKIAAGVAV